jgi:hypothetical protein
MPGVMMTEGSRDIPVRLVAGHRRDRHFNRASLSVGEPAGWLKRGFAVATGFCARWSSHFHAPADAKVTAGRQAGAGTSQPGVAHRRAPTVVATG